MYTSRDVLTWRAQPGDPVISTDALGAATGYFCADGLVSFRSGEVSLLVTPRSRESNGAYHALSWRQDGLMSLEAETAGECVTKPFVFDGESLRINASTWAGGALRFELLDASGHEGAQARAVQGRGFADCDPVTGDHLDRLVTWGDESDVSA